MFDFLSKLFDTSGFPPRWRCGAWTPAHGWLNILSDLGVWLAYLAIPCVLGYFILRRKDFPFRLVFVLFGAFILACGSTHLMEAIIFWWPAYRLAGVIKLFTAVVSWWTVFALVPVIPVALAMRSPEELEREVVQRRRAEEALQRSHVELEERVRERTEALAVANRTLQGEIGERKQAEEALQAAHRELEGRVAERTAELARANEFLQALLESIQDGIVACDADGVLNLFNRATLEFHGLPPESIPVDRWAEHYDLFRADGTTPLTREEVPLFRALRGERVQGVEMVIAPVNGRIRTLLASGQAFQDDRGNKLGAVVSMHDVTERKEAEAAIREAQEELEARVEQRTAELARAVESLREADRRKDEFLAMLGHELRNPLAPIRNALSILRMPGASADDLLESSETIDRQVEQLVRLVDDLLDVSRIMHGTIELRKERVDLAEVVARAMETMRPAIDAHGHELSVALPPEPIYVDGDLIRLAQVVGNLLHNASKYTERASRIFLSIVRDGDAAVVRVRDQGMGMSAELIPHVFDVFVQGERSLARSQGGLGIGLSLVRSLVKLHGGSVEAASPGPGLGSEFIVRLPVQIKAPRPTGGQPNGAAPPVAEPRRILVVDDNVDAAKSLARLLRRWGHTVEMSHDGLSALEAAESYRPEVVLLDIGLPGIDGYEVARRLRANPDFTTTPLAAITGYGQDDDQRRSREAGFNLHLTKPVDPTGLMDFLGSLRPD